MKKNALHTSHLRNHDQTAVLPRFEERKKAQCELAGEIPATKEGQSEPLRALHLCLTLLFWVNVRALAAVFPYQRGSVFPFRLWTQPGRECPWISLESCPTDRTNTRWAAFRQNIYLPSSSTELSASVPSVTCAWRALFNLWQSSQNPHWVLCLCAPA